MSTFTGRLDQLEAQLQDFIEGRLARLSPLRGKQDNLARRLIAAMRASALSTGDGIVLAPDRFTVLVHPSQAEEIKNDFNLLTELSILLQEIGKEANLHFINPPVVTVTPNEDVPLNHIDVITRFSDGTLSKTATLNNEPDNDEEVMPPKAFLVINGIQIFPLDRSVINIGRRSNNHLIIDDPRVSRQHAQIRASRGRFEIFDLDSTGGIFVNQKRVTQQILHPGDVISLAGIHLIYGQDESTGKTRELKVTTDSE